MNKPQQQKTFLPKVRLAAVLVGSILLLSGCSMGSFWNSTTNLAGGLRDRIVNFLNRQPVETRLAAEDPKLLCHNKEYATQYTSIYPDQYPKITEEMIKAKTKELEDTIANLTKAQGLADKEDAAFLADEIKQAEIDLAKAKAGNPTLWYSSPSSSNRGQQIQDANQLAKLFYTDKELQAGRSSLITLDQASFEKFSTALKENSDQAFQDISDLGCMEELSLPPSGGKGFNLYILGNLKKLKWLRTGIDWFGLTSTDKFSGTTIIKSTDRFGISVFRKWQNLKMLDLATATLDYTCVDVLTPAYNGTLYSGYNSLSRWGQGNVSQTSLDPREWPICGPRVYSNHQATDKQGKVEKYQVCGSDLKQLKYLKLNKLVTPMGALLNTNTVNTMESLKYLTMKSVTNPIPFSTTLISNPLFDPTADSSSPFSVQKLWPDLEYLDVSGSDITAAPFGNLLKLKYLDMSNIQREGLDYSFLPALKDNLKELKITDTVLPATYCTTLTRVLGNTKVDCKAKASRAEHDAKITNEGEKLQPDPYPGGLQLTLFQPHYITQTDPSCSNSNEFCPKITTPDGSLAVNISYSGNQVNWDYAGGDNLSYGTLQISWSASGKWWDQNKAALLNKIKWLNWDYDLSAEKMLQGGTYELPQRKSWLDQEIEDLFSILGGGYPPDSTPPQDTGEGWQFVGRIVDMPKAAFDEMIAQFQPPADQGEQTVTVCSDSFDKTLWDLAGKGGLKSVDYNSDDQENDYDTKGYLQVIMGGKTVKLPLALSKPASSSLKRTFTPALDSMYYLSRSFGLSYTASELMKLGWRLSTWGPQPKEHFMCTEAFNCSPAPSETTPSENSTPDSDTKPTEITWAPVLLSPDANVTVENEQVTFHWSQPNTPTPPTKYYWHATVNGEVPAQMDNWFGVDNGLNTSITYPSDKIGELANGLWVWSVGAEYPGKGIYWSEERMFTRMWLGPS